MLMDMRFWPFHRDDQATVDALTCEILHCLRVVQAAYAYKIFDIFFLRNARLVSLKEIQEIVEVYTPACLYGDTVILG